MSRTVKVVEHPASVVKELAENAIDAVAARSIVASKPDGGNADAKVNELTNQTNTRKEKNLDPNPPKG